MESKRADRRKRIKSTLDRLVKIGWIKSVIIDDKADTMDLVWTEKGRTRAGQIREILTEFRGGEGDLMALSVICRLHPSD